jgi:hypothetical protein
MRDDCDANESMERMFADVESGKLRVPCVDVRPTRDESVPDVRVLAYVGEAKDDTRPHCVIDGGGSSCQVWYRYRGYDTRRVSVRVVSANGYVAFGATGSKVWEIPDLWLVPPNKAAGCRCRFIGSSSPVRASDQITVPCREAIYCDTKIPLYSGEAPIKLHLQVEVIPSPPHQEDSA